MSHLINLLESCCTPLRRSVLSASLTAIGVFTLCIAAPASSLAQSGTTYTTVGLVSMTPVNFSDGSTWIGGTAPSAGASVVITNRVVDLDVDISLAVVSVENGGTLNLGSQTLTVTDYLNNSSGYLNANSSTVVFNSTRADNNSGDPTVDGATETTFYNVEIPAGSVVDFGSGNIGQGVQSECLITGTLSLDGGAVVLYPPFYEGASVLKYNDDYTVSTEWTENQTSASTKGVPTHVEIADGAILSFGTTSDNYTCAGNMTVNGSGSLNMATMSGDLTVTSALTVTGASGSMDMSSMTGDVIVNGNCTIGGVAGQSVTLTMPSTEGKGALDVKGDLTLGESTSNALTISGDEGNISCAGDFTLNTTGSEFGMVEFDGLATQLFAGNKITVDSLVVSNSKDSDTATNDVVFQADVDITPGGVFNPLDGTVDVDGPINSETFTMNSDATGTARIATLDNTGGGSNVNGDITFERYVPAVTDGASWLSLGNYVVGATRGDWNTSFGSDFHLVFQWDETHTVDNTDASNGANAWTIVSSDAATLEDSEFGYAVYTSANSSPTISAAGTYNASSVTTASLTLSNGAQQGGGWHVLTNPFPCPIDGGQFITENSNFSSYAQYDNSNDNFTTYTAGSPSTIDIGQSFWVQVSSAGAVSFNTSQLTHGSNSFIREVDSLEEAFFGLNVAQEDGKFGKTFIQFHQESTPGWEWEMDASHRHSGNSANPEIYTKLENGHKLNINSMGSLEDGMSIPFVVESGSQGTVIISMDEEYDLPAGTCAVIEDLETGEVAALGGDPLVVDLDSKTAYENRFVINFLSAPIFEASSSHCEGGILHFNGEDAELWDVSWEMTGGELSGSGCVTGLDAGSYDVEATDPFSQCEVHSNVTISEVCMGDFNLNGERDITDLLILLVGIQPVDNFEGSFPETDCDCDGVMTTLDLLMFLPQFGSGCE